MPDELLAARMDSSLLMPTTAKQLLRDDDSLLRQVFFNVLRHHQPNTANKVDVIYALSQAWCKRITSSLRSASW